MNAELDRLLNAQGGVVTSAQALIHLTRRGLEADLKCGVLQRVWYGIYGRGEITDALRLRGLDLATGTRIAVCLSTAASAYGFNTELDTYLHVLNPGGQQLRSARGLVVHRREGAPLTMVAGRPITTAEWTAIEVARGLRRPRALATLDAALRSGTCDRDQLDWAVRRQSGRRGIVAARELLGLASPKAESPMESEARLVMIDGGLPAPVLQYEVVDLQGSVWRLDFAWPEHRVAAEYDRGGLAQRSGRVSAGPPALVSTSRAGLVGSADHRRGCQISARRTCPPARHAATTGRVKVRKLSVTTACRRTNTHARGRIGQSWALVPGPMLSAGRVLRSCT